MQSIFKLPSDDMPPNEREGASGGATVTDRMERWLESGEGFPWNDPEVSGVSRAGDSGKCRRADLRVLPQAGAGRGA